MSLDEILEDIKGGITENIENIVVESNTLDASVPVEVKNFCYPVDKKTIDKLKRLLDLVIYKENMSKLERVDKGFAMEVFTMLPDIPATYKAKLTTSPSLINKEILEKIINTNIKENISLVCDIMDGMKNNKSIILEVKETLNRIKEYLINFRNILKDILDKCENNPIIVIDTSISVNEKRDNHANLLTDPISKIISLNDTMFMCDKFANNITNRYKYIYYDIDLEKILKNTKYVKDYLSIKDLENIVDEILNSIKNKENIISSYIKEIGNIDFNENKLNYNEIKNTIDLNEYIIEVIEYTNSINKIINKRNNIFDKIIDLLEFLKSC